MNSLLSFSLFISSLVSSDFQTIEPKEIYGPKEAKLELLIGNGGAGPTCLIQALAEDFIQQNELNMRIGWVQTISRLTLENLKDGVIDISLTYEPDLEKLVLYQGYASERTLVFNDHFILVGPKSNPAGVFKSDSVEEAFNKIAISESPFFSRNDHSGTNERERQIWRALKLKPWEISPWYCSEHLFPSESLLKADIESCYTLTDRGTFLMMNALLSNTVVYIQNEQALINRCHAMLQKTPKPSAKDFLDYLKSDRAQNLISRYSGKACAPLFTRADQDQFSIENLIN